MLSIEDYLFLLRLGRANFSNPRERGGVDGKAQKRQKTPERKEDHRYYVKNKSKIKRDSKKYYHQVCKKNKKCMQKREEYRENPKKYKRRKAGDIILYDQENPANNEIKQPDSNVNYRAVSPTHYVYEPDDRAGLPAGNDLPDKHLDDVPPATSKVVPNGQYVKSAGFHKSGARIEDLIKATGRDVISKAAEVSVKPKRFIPKDGFWSFTSTGSQGTYTIKIKGIGIKEGNIKSLSKASVRVSCNCGFFRWQGPEHWAKKEGYLYGQQEGSASKPVLKDPKGKHRVCKHIIAAFKLAEGYKSASSPSSTRVASTYKNTTALSSQNRRCKNGNLQKLKGKVRRKQT